MHARFTLPSSSFLPLAYPDTHSRLACMRKAKLRHTQKKICALSAENLQWRREFRISNSQSMRFGCCWGWSIMSCASPRLPLSNAPSSMLAFWSTKGILFEAADWLLDSSVTNADSTALNGTITCSRDKVKSQSLMHGFHDTPWQECSLDILDIFHHLYYLKEQIRSKPWWKGEVKKAYDRNCRDNFGNIHTACAISFCLL